MRIKNLFLIFIIFTFLVKPVFANFDVNARTAIVQDYLSGKILFEKDADRQIFPASMTKIMNLSLVLARKDSLVIYARKQFHALIILVSTVPIV